MTPKTKDEVTPNLASSILTSQESNLSCMPSTHHTNKVGSQPNDYRGLDNIQQLKYNQMKVIHHI